MVLATDLIQIFDTDYTYAEALLLGSFVCDALFEGGFDFNITPPEAMAKIVSDFTAIPEVWEEGRKNLKKFGKYIASLYIDNM